MTRHLSVYICALLTGASCGNGGAPDTDLVRAPDGGFESRSLPDRSAGPESVDDSRPADLHLAIDERDLIPYVDPMIGTKGQGNVIPGALLPHGMVRLSPNTREELGSIDAYDYSRDRIDGFAHLHLEGPGGSGNGYSNILMTAGMGDVKTDPEGYSSTFSHETEEAKPGYYAVTLEDPGVRVELTAALRAGIHRYSFQEAGKGWVLVDLGYTRGASLGGSLAIVDERTIRGRGDYTMHPALDMLLATVDGYTSRSSIYFYARFSRPFAAFGTWDQGGATADSTAAQGKRIGAWTTFQVAAGDAVEVRVGISLISEAQAQANLEADIGEATFEEVRQAASASWNTLLNRVQVEGGTPEQLTTFYTALYHSLFQPADYTEAGGLHFLAVDGQPGTYPVDGWRYYTDDWCMWDTFRTSHPLGTIVEPELRDDIVKSMLRWYEVGGWLPKCTWHAAGYSRVMIGNHAVSIIVDSLVKGLDDFDREKAWAAVFKAATQDIPNPLEDSMCGYLNLGTPPAYLELGYVPHECDGTQAASMTLEYAYNDWCTGVMAELLGKTAAAAQFHERAGNWRHQWNPKTGFMQGRMADGSWLEPFDPANASDFNSFCEASSWIYSWFVPHDVPALVELTGGNDSFVKRLDDYFDQGHHDPTNQPGFHVSFLYHFAGQPMLSAERTSKLMVANFGVGPDGLPGNDDAGAMSAWFVLSAIGLYPVAPGNPVYQLIPPLFERVTIHLHPAHYPGGAFAIERTAAGNAPTLNGTTLDRHWITHSELTAGGLLLVP